MDQVVIVIEMEAKAIQQQNMGMTQNHQAPMHQWDVARVVATTSFVSQPQEQAELTPSSRGINYLSSVGGLRHGHLSEK